MNWRKGCAIFFLILGILLSDFMCAAVAFNYVDMVWGIKYAGYSAPASTAFRLFIPFGVAIAVCLLISWVFWIRSKEAQKRIDAQRSAGKKSWREKEAFMGKRAKLNQGSKESS